MAFEMCRKSAEHILGGDVRFAQKRRKEKGNPQRGCWISLPCFALPLQRAEQSLLDARGLRLRGSLIDAMRRVFIKCRIARGELVEFY
jgi:hypothetical protein